MTRAPPASLMLWEFPQNLLGASLLGLLQTSGDVVAVEHDRDRLFIECRHVAVSLGWFVFWTPHDHRTREHEYGHTLQSRRFGPAYLLLVGIPSVSRVLYALAYRRIRGREWAGYYDGWPEKQADTLGGVRRTLRRSP